MTKTQKEEFIRLSNKLIEFLNNNHHPHTHIIITSTSAEIYEGIIAFENVEFIRD